MLVLSRSILLARAGGSMSSSRSSHWQNRIASVLVILSRLQPATGVSPNGPKFQFRPLSVGSSTEEDDSDGYDQEVDKTSRPPRSFDFIDPGPIPPLLHTKAYPTTFPLARQVLREHHGFSTFRGEQERVIARLQEKGPTIYMMRTGGGKSLIYQILARTIPEEGVILIVEPLISLLRDQVKAAQAVGLAAEGIDGTMTEGAIKEVCKRLKKKKIRMLYVSPERLHARDFLQNLSHNSILMLVIDEVHLIPLEGPKFRTSYLDLASFYHKYFPDRLLLTTATATEPWLQDLACAFQVPEKGIFRASVYRPNLSLQVKEVEKLEDKYQETLDALQEPGAAIIYVAKRKLAENLAEKLGKAMPGREVLGYHARMHSKVRNHVQEMFTSALPGKDTVVVATKAFGMGLNKSNVRQIIHYDLSPNPSEYLQEVGRAGRDGMPSRCLTLLHTSDPRKSERIIRAFQPTLHNVYKFLCGLSRKTKYGKESIKFEYDLFKVAQNLDIEYITLQQIVKILELKLDFQYIEHVSMRSTPFEYRIRQKKPKKGQEGVVVEPEESFMAFKKRILATDPSAEAKALLEHSYRKNSKWFVDMRDIISEDIILQDLQNKMLDWGEEYKIYLLSLGQIDIFKVVKALPTTDDLLRQLAKELHQELSRRVEIWLQGLETMVRILEGQGGQCIASRLARLYGSEIPGPGTCGICTVCTKANQSGSRSEETTKSEIDLGRETPSYKNPHSGRKRTWQRRYLRELELFEKVYETIAGNTRTKLEKHDAEFLSKFAFGVFPRNLAYLASGTKRFSEVWAIGIMM